MPEWVLMSSTLAWHSTNLVCCKKVDMATKDHFGYYKPPYVLAVKPKWYFQESWQLEGVAWVTIWHPCWMMFWHANDMWSHPSILGNPSISYHWSHILYIIRYWVKQSNGSFLLCSMFTQHFPSNFFCTLTPWYSPTSHSTFGLFNHLLGLEDTIQCVKHVICQCVNFSDGGVCWQESGQWAVVCVLSPSHVICSIDLFHLTGLW